MLSVSRCDADRGVRVIRSAIAISEEIELKKGRMSIALNNRLKMPIVGLGVWRMEKKDIRDLILNSLNLGYRHFDCAGSESLFHLFIYTLPFLISVYDSASEFFF